MRHTALVPAFCALLLALPAGAQSTGNTSDTMSMSAKPAASPKVAATQKALRSLWHGHIVAVRKVAVAAIGGDSAAEKTAEGEVVANAHAIANALAPFYGQPASDKMFTLLAGHYGAVKAYLEAAIAKDQTAESHATDQITSNAEDISTFLSGANPYLPKATLMELLQVHGSHHIAQIQELIAHDSVAEKKTWKAMSAHMNVIADALADALAKQFPQKF